MQLHYLYGLESVTKAEMRAIEVEHLPTLMQRTLPPRFKVVREALIGAIVGAGDFERLP